MRPALRVVLRLVLRIFFRRIEVSGLERVPASGPVLFVLNHPNGLIDPAFLMCFSPRRVSFLAKAPLFRMPVIGWVCRRFEAIPVYRRQDEGSDPAQNQETFEAARRVLTRGGAIAIFPEGTSHNDPVMRPFKTGAARIALGARAAIAGEPPITIVPAGIYYRTKQTFRSVALLYFGEPFTVRPLAEPLAPGAEPPAEPVRELTAQIRSALDGLTVQARRAEALSLVARAQRIVSTSEEVLKQPPSLAEELELRRRLVLGHEAVRRRWPDRVAVLERRITRYEAALKAAGVEARHLTPQGYTATRVARYALQSVGVLALLPLALLGAIVHYPTYRLVGHIATGVAKGDEEALASVKVLAAMLLFPLTWAVAGAAAWVWLGAREALVVVLLLPLAGLQAVRFGEGVDRIVGRVRALMLLLVKPSAFLRLVAERRSIREEIIILGRDLDAHASP